MTDEEADQVRKTMEKRFYDCVFDNTLTSLIFKFQRDMVISRSMNLRQDNDERHSLPAEPVEIYDIFGHEKTSKKMVECECYICHRMIAAARFAPHMEKCIGIGRTARQTRSRTAASYAEAALSSIDSRARSTSTADDEDSNWMDDNDDEWSNSGDAKKKRGRARAGTRRKGKKN